MQPIQRQVRSRAHNARRIQYGTNRCDRPTSSGCGELVLFVTDGPRPGWWSHDLVPDPAHPAVPEVHR